MIKPRHCLRDGPDGRYFGQGRPAQQDDRKPEHSRRRDLAVGRSPPAILGDDDIDGVSCQQYPIGVLSERTSAGDVGCMWDRQRRIHRLDAAHEIVVLRRSSERSDLRLTEREKNTARLRAERLHGGAGIGDLHPTIAGKRRPGRASQREQGNACGCRRGGGIGRDARGVGVCRVDEDIDALACEILCKALSAAESADPHRRGLCGRRSGAASERDRNFQLDAFNETFRQAARFRGPTENEDASHDVD